MDTSMIIGVLAGIFTTIAVIPQIIRTWRTKKVKDVSIGMFIVLITGVLLWCVYGIIRQDWPIIITNGISVGLNVLMLYFIVKFKGQ